MTYARPAARPAQLPPGSVLLPASLAESGELMGSIGDRPWRTALIAWSIRGEVDARLFRRVLESMARRHDALRTHLAVTEGEVVKVVVPEIHVPFRFVDALARGGAPRVVAHEVAREDLDRPLSLIEAPLWRASLVRLEPSLHVLQLVVAHTIWDAISSKVFADETTALYGALVNEGDASVPAVELQPGDVAEWEYTASNEVNEAYWAQRLAAWPSPSVIATEAVDSRPFTVRLVELPEVPSAVVGRLMRLARERSSTLHSVLLAGYIALLHAWSGKSRVPVGVADANRDLPGSTGTIGNLITYVPICSDVRRSWRFDELVSLVTGDLFEAYSRKWPLPRILAGAGSTRHRSLRELWQTTFNYRPSELGLALAERDQSVLAMEPVTATAEYHDSPVTAVWWSGVVDLNIDVLPSRQLIGELTFDDRPVDVRLATSLVRAYTRGLEIVAEHPSANFRTVFAAHLAPGDRPLAADTQERNCRQQRTPGAVE